MACSPEPYVPPHVIPPERASLSLRALREAAHCVIKTWPKAMYEDSVWEHPAGGIVHVMSPDLVRMVLLDRPDIFVPGRVRARILQPIWRNGLAVADGEAWRWQRKAASRAFSPAASLDVVPHANRAAQVIISRWQRAEGQIEITRPLQEATTHVVLDALFDRLGDETRRRRIVEICEKLDSGMGRMNYADILRLPSWCRRFLGPTFDRPARRLHQLVAPLLHAKLAVDRPVTSLLGDLARAVDPATARTMAEALIEDQVVGSIAAGRETTALALAWTLHLLAQQEPTAERMRAEIARVVGDGPIEPEHIEHLSLTRSVLLESMRLYPPAPVLSRDCLEDTVLADHKIRKGSIVIVPVYAIHRHKALWSDPDAFVPERFEGVSLSDRDMRFQYLPFGAGPRICIGMSFAINEAIVILARLVRAFRFEQSGSVDFAVGAALRPKGGLRLRVSSIGPVQSEDQLAIPALP